MHELAGLGGLEVTDVRGGAWGVESDQGGIVRCAGGLFLGFVGPCRAKLERGKPLSRKLRGRFVDWSPRHEDDRREAEARVERDVAATSGGWELNPFEVPPATVNSLLGPELLDREQGVLEAWDASDVGECERNELAIPISRYHGKVADGRRSR